jgi:hypothetical protein
MASCASTGKTGDAASRHRGRHHRHAIAVLMAGKKKIRTHEDGRARDARMRERKKKAGYMLACNQLHRSRGINNQCMHVCILLQRAGR